MRPSPTYLPEENTEMNSIPECSTPCAPAPPAPPQRGGSRGRRWWAPSLVLAAVATALFVPAAASVVGAGRVVPGSAGWWLLTTVLHVPLLVILCFLAGGLGERFGFYVKGRAAAAPGRLPTPYPTVCVQLPMFNEHSVARRVIEAASARERRWRGSPLLLGRSTRPEGVAHQRTSRFPNGRPPH